MCYSQEIRAPARKGKGMPVGRSPGQKDQTLTIHMHEKIWSSISSWSQWSCSSSVPLYLRSHFSLTHFQAASTAMPQCTLALGEDHAWQVCLLPSGAIFIPVQLRVSLASQGFQDILFDFYYWWRIYIVLNVVIRLLIVFFSRKLLQTFIVVVLKQFLSHCVSSLPQKKCHL